MIKISIGNGKFHLIFKSANNFFKALSSSYLNQSKKRCWSLYSKKDNLIIIQPSVSTRGLNVLILNTINMIEKEINGVFDILKKADIQIITADSIRRPPQAQGFTVWFIGVESFIQALNTFYPDGKRCRAVVPENGPLLIQPIPSTSELNTLVLEHYSSILGKQRIEAVIAPLEKNECDTIVLPIKTTNFF